MINDFHTQLFPFSEAEKTRFSLRWISINSMKKKDRTDVIYRKYNVPDLCLKLRVCCTVDCERYHNTTITFFQVVRNEKLWLEFIVYMRLPSCLLSCLWKFASLVWGCEFQFISLVTRFTFFISLSLLSFSVNEFKSSFYRYIKNRARGNEWNCNHRSFSFSELCSLQYLLVPFIALACVGRAHMTKLLTYDNEWS